MTTFSNAGFHVTLGLFFSISNFLLIFHIFLTVLITCFAPRWIFDWEFSWSILATIYFLPKFMYYIFKRFSFVYLNESIAMEYEKFTKDCGKFFQQFLFRIMRFHVESQITFPKLWRNFDLFLFSISWSNSAEFR